MELSKAGFGDTIQILGIFELLNSIKIRYR
jgi:hypothetical protein